MTRIEKQDAHKREGDRLKKEIRALAARLDRKGRLRLKLALMQGGASETVARRLMNGDYEACPRQDLLETMEGVLASFGKAKAS